MVVIKHNNNMFVVVSISYTRGIVPQTTWKKNMITKNVGIVNNQRRIWLFKTIEFLCGGNATFMQSISLKKLIATNQS